MALLPDKAVVTLTTTVPIVSVVIVACLCGKIMSDVSNMRALYESQSMTIRNVVQRMDNISERVAAVEAYIGVSRQRDGQRRNAQ